MFLLYIFTIVCYIEPFCIFRLFIWTCVFLCVCVFVCFCVFNFLLKLSTCRSDWVLLFFFWKKSGNREALKYQKSDRKEVKISLFCKKYSLKKWKQLKQNMTTASFESSNIFVTCQLKVKNTNCWPKRLHLAFSKISNSLMSNDVLQLYSIRQLIRYLTPDVEEMI